MIKSGISRVVKLLCLCKSLSHHQNFFRRSRLSNCWGLGLLKAFYPVSFHQNILPAIQTGYGFISMAFIAQPPAFTPPTTNHAVIARRWKPFSPAGRHSACIARLTAPTLPRHLLLPAADAGHPSLGHTDLRPTVASPQRNAAERCSQSIISGL